MPIKVYMQLLVNTHFISQGIFKQQSSFTVNCAYSTKFGRYLVLSTQYFTINILLLYVDNMKRETAERVSLLLLNAAEG